MTLKPLYNALSKLLVINSVTRVMHFFKHNTCDGGQMSSITCVDITNVMLDMSMHQTSYSYLWFGGN
jgi:hypothetical protein